MSRVTDVNGLYVPELGDAPPDIETAFGLADEIDTLLVSRFSSLAERNAAITAPTSGQMCYVTATGELYLYRGSAWVSAVARTKYKSVAEAFGTGTPSNDDDMVVALEASSLYTVKGIIRTTSDSDANDLSCGWTIPSGATGRWNLAGFGDLTETSGTGEIYRRDFDWDNFITAASNSAAVYMYPFRGHIATAGTAGNLQLQACEAVSTGGASVYISGGSYIEILKVA